MDLGWCVGPMSLDLSDRSRAIADFVDIHARALEHRQQYVRQGVRSGKLICRDPLIWPQARPTRAVGNGY